MIYRADFTVDNLKGRLISPVIFGNIAKIYFDIFSEEKANQEIDRLIKSNTLISDMLCKENLPFKIENVKNEKEKLLMIADSDIEQDLIEKRKKFREYKKQIKKIELEQGVAASRLRNSINRLSGTTDKELFLHDEFKYDKKKVFSIYVSTEDNYVIDLMELAFMIIEKVGIGTDTSIGNGVMKFKRYGEKVFVEANDIKYLDDKNQGFNIASTIISKVISGNYEFRDYRVKRYDSRTPEKIKACYYYIECGSIVKCINKSQSYIISNPNDKYKTYTCVFPVKFKGVDINESK